MKKLICTLLSASIAAGSLALPLGVSAASSPVKLKKSSATLLINSEDEKSVAQTVRIKLKTKKGVKLKKISYKSSSTKVATVSKKGVVKAKKSGKARISVKVSYKYNKKTCSKTLKFKVTVLTNEQSFLKKLSKFSNKLYSLSAENEKSNYTMSPVSVYMALAMLHNIGDSDVRKEVESFVGMSESDIFRTGALYKKLVKKYDDDTGKTVAQLNLTNSIWIDSGEKANPDALKKLADELFCTSGKVPFSSDNKAANDAVRKFVKEKTNGLIDQDFGLSADTLYALINTLYFKDIWSNEIRKLDTVDLTFNGEKGAEKKEFIKGEYLRGVTQKTSDAEYFYAETAHGYKMKFILPNKGVSLKKAMSAEKLSEINARKDYGKAVINGAEHYTRCIFPGFKLDSDTPLKSIFKKNKVLEKAFFEFYSPLSDKALCISDIKHRAVLRVDREGAEGAAVTIMVLECAAAMPVKIKEYHDFVLDRPFGFIITSPDDVILFEGQVTDP